MKNKHRTPNNEQRTYKAFTLIELVVAVALLAMVFLFAGTIFKVCINSYRTAVANAEIIQKLRAITDQLNADFKGFRKDAPVVVAFTATGSDPNEIRSDRILFFSDGDFQSTRQYDSGGSDKTVVGNVARIYYGQSVNPDPNTKNTEDFREVILARKLQILTADDTLADTDPNVPNDFNEYTKKSLSEWKLVEIPSDLDELSGWIGRPDVHIDLDDPVRMENIMPAFMAKGVHNFKIQLMESIDPGGSIVWWPTNQQIRNDIGYGGVGYPPAFKFTFTLYDSKGVIKEGRTFTHIVYLGE
jgi:prepilin-type N-terminal cleavage/methylation domain-containing protein